MKISNEKKKKKVELLRSRKEKADEYKSFQVPVEITSNTENKISKDEEEFIQSKFLDLNEQLPKKHSFTKTDDMPLKYRNVRLREQKVCLEIYKVIQKLKSTLHMSQAERSIVEIANTVFGRNKFGPWKVYKPNEPYDINTLPASSNTNRLDPYLKAMVLCSITEQMMISNNSTVVYSNDRSGMSGVGNYVVQSVTINGKQQTLPTMCPMMHWQILRSGENLYMTYKLFVLNGM